MPEFKVGDRVKTTDKFTDMFKYSTKGTVHKVLKLSLLTALKINSARTSLGTFSTRNITVALDEPVNFGGTNFHFLTFCPEDLELANE